MGWFRSYYCNKFKVNLQNSFSSHLMSNIFMFQIYRKILLIVSVTLVVYYEIGLFYSIYCLSLPSNPRYPYINRYLHDGWLGRMDLSDHQHRFFRNSMGMLSVVMALHTFISFLFKSHFKVFTSIFSIIFIFALHGVNAFKILFLVAINFAITKQFGKTNAGVIGLWIWHISMILTMEQLDFKLPYFQGIVTQWIVYYKFNILRMISFTMDHKWTNKYELIDKKDVDEQRFRITTPCNDYTFLTYFRYVLYPPLYLAGPIITFNDFVHQQTKVSQNKIIKNGKEIFFYALRLAAILLFMEFFARYVYVNAISKDGKQFGFHGYSSIQLCIIGYLALMHIWLKLLVLWRFFRLWAMMDGIETPENMTKCMSNNYSPMNFWKHWHRSFNKWIVRYLYIPLGGNKTYIWNIWIVFTFVALWHDIELKLLIWGWVIALFIVPEYLCKSVFKKYTVIND